MTHLTGKRIAILVTDGFEQEELTKPKAALERAGATTNIVSPKTGKVKGWKHDKWGDEFDVDAALKDVKAADYDALVLPGGVINPDTLRLDDDAIEFIKNFHKLNKPIAAICHGPWLLINTGIAKDSQLTSWPSIRLDLTNAGATWVDKEVVVDKKLVTSRKPADIPAFNEQMINLISME